MFDRMLTAGLPPSQATYTALLSLFCRAGAVPEAACVLDGMKAAGLQPNTISYSSLINGCEKAGSLRGALRYFDEMLVRAPPACLTACLLDGLLACLLACLVRGCDVIRAHVRAVSRAPRCDPLRAWIFQETNFFALIDAAKSRVSESLLCTLGVVHSSLTHSTLGPAGAH